MEHGDLQHSHRSLLESQASQGFRQVIKPSQSLLCGQFRAWCQFYPGLGNISRYFLVRDPPGEMTL